jgi:5-methylcytosine-specific restriction endonuclease McrA
MNIVERLMFRRYMDDLEARGIHADPWLSQNPAYRVERVDMRFLYQVDVGLGSIGQYKTRNGRVRLAGLSARGIRGVHPMHRHRARATAYLWLGRLGRHYGGFGVHVLPDCPFDDPVVFITRSGFSIADTASLNEVVYQSLYAECYGECCCPVPVKPRRDTLSRWQRIKRAGYQPNITWLEIAERDQWACQLCWQPLIPDLRGQRVPDAPEIDHIVPVSKGGSHTRENLQLLCRRCNGRKGARMLTDINTRQVEASA